MRKSMTSERCGDWYSFSAEMTTWNNIDHDSQNYSIIKSRVNQRFKKDVPTGPRGSAHTALHASCTDVTEWSLSASDLTMHDTSYFNPIMTWIVIYYEAEIFKRSSEMGSGGPSIVENPCMFYFGHVYNNAFVTSLWLRCHKNLHKIWTEICERKYV